MLDDGALLRAATDRRGGNPLTWMAGPLQSAGRVLEVGGRPGGLADQLPLGRWIGLAGCGGPGPMPRARADPAALPVRTSAVDGIALPLALPRLPDLDALFAELRRALRPGGTLVLLVPSALARSAVELRWAPVLSAVHRHWRHRSALDRAGWLLNAADFAVLGDDRVSFALPLPDDAAADTLVDRLPQVGIWPADLPVEVRDRARSTMRRLGGPGRVLPVPLRRLVARR